MVYFNYISPFTQIGSKVKGLPPGKFFLLKSLHHVSNKNHLIYRFRKMHGCIKYNHIVHINTMDISVPVRILFLSFVERRA